MATAMTCSQCWTTVAAGKTHCPRCGAKLTGAPPSFTGLLKSYPWLGVLLALSLFATIWAATRRPAPAPAPEVIPAAVEPVLAPPAEPVSDEPLPPPPMPAPEPVPAVEAAPVPRLNTEDPPPAPSGQTHQNPDGTWGNGPAPSR